MQEKPKINIDEQQQQAVIYTGLPSFDKFGNIVKTTTRSKSVEEESIESAPFFESEEYPISLDEDDFDSKADHATGNTSSMAILPATIEVQPTEATFDPAPEENLAPPVESDVNSEASSATVNTLTLPVSDFITACQQGNLDDLQRLFLKPASLHNWFMQARSNGKIPSSSNYDEHLLEYQGKLLFANDRQAFIAAASNNHDSVMQVLLSKCTSNATLLQTIRAQGDAAFKNAFKDGHTKALKVILLEVYNLHKTDKSVFQELTGAAFKDAACKGDISKMKLLLNSAPSLEAAELIISSNTTAFAEASTHKHLETMQWLLSKADPKTQARMLTHAFVKIFQERNLDGLNALLDILPEYLPNINERMALINQCVEAHAATLSDVEKANFGSWLYKEKATHGLFPDISEAFVAASSKAQEFVMGVLLDMSADQPFRQPMVQKAFQNACQKDNSIDLETLLTIIPEDGDERDKLISSNNDQAFTEASRDGRVNTMRVLMNFTTIRSAQNAMLQAASFKPWESAIAKNQTAVLEFHLEHYAKTGDIVTFNQMIDEGTILARKGNKESVLRLFADFVAAISSEVFYQNSWDHAILHDQINVLRFYCEQLAARKDNDSLFSRIKEGFLVANVTGNTQALDLFLEFFDDKNELKKFVTGLQGKLVGNQYPTYLDYLDPEIAWKTGKRLRELKEKGYNFEKVEELLAFAKAVNSEYRSNRLVKKDAAAIPYQSTTSLTPTDKEIVFGILTTPMPSVSQRLSQLTIRRSAERPPIQLTMNIDTLQERTVFYKRFVEQAKIASQGSGRS